MDRGTRWAVTWVLVLSLAVALGAMSPGPALGLSDQDYRLFLGQSEEFSQADRALNEAYKTVAAGLDEAGKARLKASQKAWLQERDAKAARLASAQGKDLPAAYAQLARERATQLRTQFPPAGKQGAWAGEWERVGMDRFNTATLTITQTSPASFSFELEAMSGGNSGQVSGQAQIQGNRARFLGEDGCRLDFSLAKGRVKVSGNPGCQYYAGNGVRFHGDYAPGAEAGAPASPPPQTAQEKALAALTGEYYQLFLDTMQMESEDEDLDGLGAQVKSYGVRGLFTAQESMVMHGPGGQIWAAVIDGEVLRYFTNDPARAQTPPRTIEQWRERFADKKVVSMPGAGR